MQDILNEIGRPSKIDSPGVKETGPMSPLGLYELFLFSALAYMLAALLVQLLMNIQYAVLLRIFKLKFTYLPLGVKFSYISAARWSDFKIFIVYGLTPLVFFILGMAILWLLREKKIGYWKFRMFLTWLAFILIHTIPAGLLAGIGVYDGLGVAYAWLADSLLIRVMIGIAVIVLIRFYRIFWLTLFLKTAYAGVFFIDFTNRRVFLTNAFIRPYIMGTIFLVPFVYTSHSLFWGVFLAGLGIIVLPFVSSEIPNIDLLIVKSDKKIWPMRYPLAYIIPALILLWFLSTFSIAF
jgi:hypothetical protein